MSGKSICGLGCIHGKGNVLKGVIRILLFWNGPKRLCAGLNSVKFISSG